MSENDLSHIDMVADSVGSDTCHCLWVLRVVIFTKTDCSKQKLWQIWQILPTTLTHLAKEEIP